MKKLLLAGSIFFSVKLAVGQTPVTSTSFELFGDHIFIQLSVDDSEPLDFILDTGDGLSVIDMDVAKKLELSLDHKAAQKSAQGTIEGALIKHNKVELNEVLVNDIAVYATDLSHLEISIGRNIDGIIGYDLLKNYVVRLNYDDLKLDIFSHDSFTPGSEFGEAIPFKFTDFIPHISAHVTLNNGETLDGEYFVYTGAGTTLDFNTPYANAHDIINKTGEHYSYLVKGIEEKEYTHYEGKVKSFRFGTFEFKELPIGISQADHGVQAHKKIAGIIGNRLLRRFNITFDFKHHKIYLIENGHYYEEFHVNASGVDLQLAKDQKSVLIHQVYANSPAAQAGIEVNAELISVNGQDAQSLTLPKLQEMLNKAGETVEIVVRQGGEEKKAVLTLKDLI